MSIILSYLSEHLIAFVEKELVNAAPEIEQKIMEEVHLLIEKLKNIAGNKHAA